MFRIIALLGALSFALMLSFFVPHPAFAEDATAPTTVAVLPFYQAIEPYLVAAFGVLISALLTWLVAQFQTRTGILVSDQAKAAVQQAAVNAAGRILASQEGNVAGLKIDVHSPLIAAEVPKLQASVGDAISKLGMTPERVGDLIAGKIGQLQVAASAPASPIVISGQPVKPS